MMVLGGSLGNIFDRLFYSSVPDFIDLHFYNFNWFIFNVADIFITLGVILLIYLEFFKKKIYD
jgi:signal peptidase II